MNFMRFKAHTNKWYYNNHIDMDIVAYTLSFCLLKNLDNASVIVNNIFDFELV